MDQSTFGAYEREAKSFARAWHEQPSPLDLYAALRQFFRPGPTADIGCGSGRDTAWLDGNGFPAVGYDPSEGLLEEARRRYPQLRLEKSALPALDGVAETSFANVLCETVIMHLAADRIAPAVRRLTAILAPGGTLYLSWRVTDGHDRRDEHGRLYAAFDPSLVVDALSPARILLDERITSASSGKKIHRIVARKDGP